MKKGCFISVIIFLTILLMVIFYTVRFHGNEILEAGKDTLVELAISKIHSDINNLESNDYVDSLKIVVDNYFENLDSLDIKKELEKIEEFSDDIEVIFLDSKIDSAEFDFITNILVKYEQRKEN
ncbi:MAG: hypothetical protein H6611_06415 [Ignavibacteriales bacterium]|nr:hypothetical protein [Ignavibacteriales bacterium]MCB9209835.1 hypothetical protein [Ignavibacteriales bacterium]